MSRVGTLLSTLHMADGKDEMISNVEELQVRERRSRFQHNMPVTFETADLDFYLTCRHPDPGPGTAESYIGPEILPTHEPANPQQIIEYEKASSTDALATNIRRLKSERRQLKQEYTSDLKRYWNILISTKTIMKVFYKPQVQMVQLGIKRKRICVGSKTVRRRVSLKPRLIPQYKRVSDYRGGAVDFTKLRIRRVFTGLKLVTPRVWRDVEVPDYRYLTLRPAGLYPKKVRVRTLVRVKDWTTIRQLYASYKSDRLRALQAKLAEISNLIEELRKQVTRRPPRQMASWTDHGFVRPYPVGQRPPESLAVTTPGRSPGYQSGFSHQTSIMEKSPTYEDPSWSLFHCYWTWTSGYVPHAREAYGDISPAQIEWFGREHGLPTGGSCNVPPLKRAQGNLRFVRGADWEKQAMLAFSTVQSLTKAKDYQFQWFRSLVELKDSKQTLRTLRQTTKLGSGFLNWLASTNHMSIVDLQNLRALLKRLSSRFNRALHALAAAYLAWKFAIEPTISDVQTVVSQTTEWIFEIRRALASVLTDPNGPLNTYHARAKYGDNARVLKLGTYADILVDDRTLEISIPCTVSWASCLWTATPNPTVNTVVSEEHLFRSVASEQWPAGGTHELSLPSRLKTKVFADNGIHEYEHIFHGALMGSHDLYRYWKPGGYIEVHDGTVFHRDLTVSPSPAELEQRICRDVFNRTPVVERVPVYATSWTSGVVFAEYRIDDLLELLSHTSGAMPGCAGLMNRVYEGAGELLTRLDLVKTAWELTPLSFVYDWFTDSGTLATILANAARSNWTVYNQTPRPLHGLWESRRSELLAGTPLYQVTGCDCVEYSTLTPLVDVRTGTSSVHRDSVCEVVADHSVRRYRLRLRCIDDKVHLMRTGLYRVRRGEQSGYDGLLSYLPKVSVSVQGGKILSLSALITSLLGGEGR